MKYSEEVLGEASKLGIGAELIAPDQVTQIRAEVVRRYCGDRAGVSLWESFENEVSVHSRELWRELGSVVDTAPALMFFEKDRDGGGVRVYDSSRLAEIVGECTVFEFYVTDVEVSYVVCLTRYDILVGVGRAVEWVRRLADKLRADDMR